MKIFCCILFFIPLWVFAQQSNDTDNIVLSAWQQYPSGRWNTTDFSSVDNLLWHNFDNSSAGEDRLSVAFPQLSLNEGKMQWSFSVRHGNNPSASNCWALFLTSENDAATMLPNSTNAYILGVNYNGSSNDKIGLWYQDGDNNTEEILLTDFNWQELIGTSEYQTIVVERTKNADWKIFTKNSDTGELQLIGTTIHEATFSANYFGLYYKYTKTGDRNLWMKDVSISYTPSNTNNFTSTVEPASNPISDIDIDTEINVIENAKAVFRFSVNDNATGDELPTVVKKIELLQSKQGVELTNGIKYAALSSNGNLIAIDTVQILDDRIVFLFEEHDFTIADGEHKAVDLLICLHPKEQTDGTLLQFYIKQDLENWLAYDSGSGFYKDGVTPVFSASINIQVKATALQFSVVPENVKLNTLFAVEVIAVDRSGNIDTDNAENIVLSLSGGEGTLHSLTDFQMSLNNGTARWEQLTYNDFSSIVLQITSSNETLQAATATAITVSADDDSFLSQAAQNSATVLSSTIDNWGDAQRVFCFYINDAGTADQLPTTINQLELQNVFPENGADWSNTIAGARLKANGNELLCRGIDINDDRILIDIAKGTLTVPDGDSTLIEMAVWLNDRKIADGSILQFKIGTERYYHLYNDFGSAFVNNANELFSNKIRLEVEAVQIAAKEYPKYSIGVNQPFDYIVNAVDNNGNIDIDYNSKADLKLYNGNGNLMVEQAGGSNFVDGEIAWQNLAYDKAGQFSLLAISNGLTALISPTIIAADTDSYIELLNIPLDTIIPSTTVKPEAPHQLLKFKLVDKGTSDSLPTIVRTLRFDIANKSNSANKAIAGIKLFNENEDTVTVSGFEIDKQTLIVHIADELLQVQDGANATFVVAVYLSKANVADNSWLQLRIPAQEFNWDCTANSSLFSAYLPYDWQSSVFRLQVDASKFSFVNYPLLMQSNSLATVKVAATDAYGNIDADYTERIQLLNDDLKFETAQPAISGIASFNIEAVDDCKITASSNAITTSDKAAIEIADNVELLFSESFDTPYVFYADDWRTEIIIREKTDTVLSHNLFSKHGEDLLTFPLTFQNPNLGTLCWQFSFYWDNNSSQSNHFAFCLLRDKTTGSAYELGIAPGQNKLSLWEKKNNGSINPLILTDCTVAEGESFIVKAKRNATGRWQLWYKKNDKHSVWFKSAAVNGKTQISADSMGLSYHYSSTRSGRFKIDDVVLQYAKMPAEIISCQLTDNELIEVVFNREVLLHVDTSTALLLSNSKGDSIEINEVILSKDAKTLYIDALLSDWGEYSLHISKITDSENFEINDSTGFAYKNYTAEVLINEIMADPEPNVQLPPVEYVELYNASDVAVSLQGWQFCYGSDKILLPDSTLNAGEYLILCNSDSEKLLRPYGKTLSVSDFPALNNTGQLLQLFNRSKQLVSWVAYSNSWYNNEVKKEGGWSLERISPNYSCEGSRNWSESVHLLGGTPGTVNSVDAPLSDEDVPVLQRAAMQGDSVVLLYFNEAIDYKNMPSPFNFTIDDFERAGIVETNFPYNDVLKLHYNTKFQKNKLYNIEVEGLKNCNNLSVPPHTIAPIAVPEPMTVNDIIINEILFNPLSGNPSFIELYNRSDKVLDLHDCIIATGYNTSGYKYYQPSEQSYLFFPHTYVVITNDATALVNTYDIDNINAVIQPDNALTFNDDSSAVVLFNRSFVTIDSIYYQQEQHYAIMNKEGVSLERINPEQASTDKDNWHSAASVFDFATPGAKNSQYRTVETTKSNLLFTLDSDNFSPDNDGFMDALEISYNLPKAGYTCNITVYSDEGQLEKHIAQNELLPTDGQFYWYGLRNNKNLAPLGIYIIFVELFDLHGNVEQFKLPVLLKYR